MIDELLALDPAVRYVAVYRNGELEMKSRSDCANASEEGTDVFEELLVNPTLLKLATQRGNIDCGGLVYLLIRYGNFFQFVCEIPDGHASVCLEPSTDVVAIGDSILATIATRLPTESEK